MKMIKCNSCNEDFKHVFLDENDKKENIFNCEKCNSEKIKHRIYNKEAAEKLNKNIKQEITKCSNCGKKKIIYLSFKTKFSDEKYCEFCWNMLRIDFEFN